MKKFIDDLRYSPVTKLKAGLIALCVITWGFTVFASVNLILSLNPGTIPSPTTTPVIPAPVISDINVVDISQSGATITWTTDTPTTGEVEYWEELSSDNTVEEDYSVTVDHRIVLSDLKSETKYGFLVKSKNSAGVEAKTGLEGTFITDAAVIPVGVEVGYQAPDFTLNDNKGNPITLSNSRGKWVMLVFWETSCQACRLALPDLQVYYETIPADKLYILTVNVREQNEVIMESFLQSRKITLPVLLDKDGMVDDIYKIEQYPTTFFMDNRGIIRKVVDHRLETPEEIASTVSALIGE